jgi:hypothetical protein
MVNSRLSENNLSRRELLQGVAAVLLLDGPLEAQALPPFVL